MIFTRDEIASWPEGLKKCKECKELRELTYFGKNKGGVLGTRATCRICREPEFKAAYASRSFEQKMYVSAQYRASQKGREFNISIEDIVVPDKCPILGVPIELQSGSEYAPSLDRIDSNLGYISGNVWVISKRANTLKNNMTKNEALLIAEWFNRAG